MSLLQAARKSSHAGYLSVPFAPLTSSLPSSFKSRLNSVQIAPSIYILPVLQVSLAMFIRALTFVRYKRLYMCLIMCAHALPHVAKARLNTIGPKITVVRFFRRPPSPETKLTLGTNGSKRNIYTYSSFLFAFEK